MSVLRADNGELVRAYSLGNQFINDLKYYNGLAYIGGRFTSIASNNRRRIAAVDPGVFPFTDWSHDINDEIYAIALGYGTAFASGAFTNISGSESFSLGAMDLSQSDTPYDFMPEDPLNFGFLYDTEVYNEQLWLAGEFTTVFNDQRSHLAAIDLRCISDDIDGQAIPDSDFEFLLIDTTQLEVSFGNHSLGASRFLWDFGDGQTSSSINPVHRYAQAGIYDVCLTADHSTGRTTSCQSLSLTAVGTQDYNPATIWRLFPNPAAKYIQLQTEDATIANKSWTVVIRDMQAKIVQEVVIPAGDTSRQLLLKPNLASGSYQLEVSHEGALLWSTAIIKQ